MELLHLALGIQVAFTLFALGVNDLLCVYKEKTLRRWKRLRLVRGWYCMSTVAHMVLLAIVAIFF